MCSTDSAQDPDAWKLYLSSIEVRLATAAQVFRALQSSQEAEAASTLLACLHKCLQPSMPNTSFHDSVEICLTLQVRPCLCNLHHNPLCTFTCAASGRLAIVLPSTEALT